MASPRDLIRTIAQALCVPQGTVILHDRNLSLAGMRTVAGRGRGGAHVTFQDAANLLIAVAASRNVKDSVKTVMAYGDLKNLANRSLADEIVLALHRLATRNDVPEYSIELHGPEPHWAASTIFGGRAITVFGELHGATAGLRHCASFDQTSLLPIARLVAA